jgi:DHA1 family bicyclomycin/chloramphenicol resistance-like MFS transporter
VKGRSIVLYCGLLMSISAFSVDITLPSFPAMARDLAAPFEQVQWTITVYMVGAGFGQLLWGSLSDRFGRRPALAAGLGLFLLGCLVSALSPSAPLLLISRLLQGFGAAAAIVASRAVIRDLHSGEELARNLALATAIFAIGPIMAPLLGAGLAALAGWRFIFLALAIFAGGLLVALLRLPETLAAPSLNAMRPRVFAERTARLFRNAQSRFFLLLSALVMSSMLLILAVAPRIYDVSFSITGVVFAFYFALHGVGIVIGQMANRRFIKRLGVVDAMIAANVVLVLSSALMLVFALAGAMSAPVMTALIVLFATSYLIVFSNAAAMVLDPHGCIAGFAAAFYGFTSQIGSAVIVSLLVWFVGDGLAAFAGSLLAICLLCLVCLLAWRMDRPA